MTVDEIYTNLSKHMIQGIMTHEQLANYYDFLGLKGYKRCHEYHYLKETISYRKLCRYYINHHNKLINETEFEAPTIIPASWYRYTRQDVDANTKRNAIKTALDMWAEWEKSTKKLYEQSYKQLMELDEVASAMFVKGLICDVDCELKKVERYQLNKSATNYDMVIIIEEQHDKHEKYKKKIEEIGKELC